MPKYVLPEMEAPEFQDLDAFTQGYIQALFFTNRSCIPMTEFHTEESQHTIREGQADGDLPQDAGFLDLHPETLAAIMADCASFQTENVEALAVAYATPFAAWSERFSYTPEQAGMDYLFTRDGHGVGFWDRDLGETGETLSEAARAAGPVTAWFSEVPEHGSPTGLGWVRTD